MEKVRYVFLIPILGFTVAIISVVMSILAGIGTRFQWWNFRIGLSVLRYSAIGGLIAVAVSFIGVIVVLFLHNKKGIIYGIVGLLLGLVVFGLPWLKLQTARQVPPIHDITTDTVNPPQFSAIIPLRKNAVNPIEYGGQEIAAQQEKAYPDIKPVVLKLSPDQAFDQALKVAQQMKWDIVATDRNEGRIEAVATTFWMGFKDDVVVRITKNDSGSRVDTRSVSRVGKGDTGTNAKRIRTFLHALQK